MRTVVDQLKRTCYFHHWKYDSEHSLGIYYPLVTIRLRLTFDRLTGECWQFHRAQLNNLSTLQGPVDLICIATFKVWWAELPFLPKRKRYPHPQSQNLLLCYCP